MQKLYFFLVGVLLISVTQPTAADAAYRYVSGSGSDDANDCLVSTTPCLTIGHATAQVNSGDSVMIAGGKYKESNTINVLGDLTIIGGWDEAFTSPSSYTPTTLTAKKAQALVLSYSGSTTASVVIQGLTIAKCKVGGALRGGGLAINASDTAVANVFLAYDTFTANEAYVGGAIGTINYGNAHITLDILGSHFTKNNGTRSAGAIAMEDYGNTPTDLTVTESTFEKNSSYEVSAIMWAGGSSTPHLSMRNVTISGNKSQLGGPVRFISTAGTPQLDVSNSVFKGNKTLRDASGMTVLGYIGSTWNITTTNNTFSGNRSPENKGVIVVGGGASIVHDSSNDLVFTKPGTFAVVLGGGTTLHRRYGDFGEVGGDGQVVDGTGVISLDPTFVKKGKDIHLLAGSPAIDSGTCMGAPAYDFEGDARPNGAACDMGADEH